MTLDLDDLERQARAATPGPWHCPTDGAVRNTKGAWIAEAYFDINDAIYIAANSPDVTLALIAALREARAELAVAWECSTCGFASNVDHVCPNDGQAMTRVSWRDRGVALMQDVESLRARLSAWERAVDEWLVTNWIGVYESSESPHEAIKRAIQGAVDQDRDRLRAEVASLRAQLTAATTWSDETLDRAWGAAVYAEYKARGAGRSVNDAEAAGYAAMRAVLTGQGAKER
jgi:hypothetical protein